MFISRERIKYGSDLRSALVRHVRRVKRKSTEQQDDPTQLVLCRLVLLPFYFIFLRP